jgi:ArsR family transcriptional regulator, arsenate/arsenite/antimonite-responsive transcriptional repressor
MLLAKETRHVTAIASATATIDLISTPDSASCCTPPGTPTVTESDAETYAAWFKALADPTRIRILNLLAASEEPVCVCDITDHFPLGQPTISHHLKVLRDVRFVIAERRGTFMHYRVNHACLAEFPDAARRILNT